MTDSSLPQPVPGRACGACMLCCKLPAIASLDKPMGKWCSHAKPGSGCGIYADRPAECRAFMCRWLTDVALGPEWKPDRAKFYIAHEPGGGVQIMVDPGAPGAWRDPTYYPSIKLVAAQLLEGGAHVFVLVGRRVFVVLPDRDIDVGLVPDGHMVRVAPFREGGRIVFGVRVEAIVAPEVPDQAQ